MCVYLQLNKKKAKAEGVNVTLKTIMSTIAEKTANNKINIVNIVELLFFFGFLASGGAKGSARLV